MQIIINAPDGIPSAVIEQQVEEFESKLRKLKFQPKKQADESHKSENTLSFEQAMNETLEQNKELYKRLS